MNLQDFVALARKSKAGQEFVTLTYPAKLKIQITGPGATTILDAGPTSGESWKVLINVESAVNG